MPIEVPADENIYSDAINAMKKKIAAGKVPGVDDTEEAYSLVRRGNVTYRQAMMIAKAGTVESLVFDAANGVVAATGAFGVSAMVTFAIGIWNGHDWKESVKMAAESGLKVAGTAFVSTVISSQLTRVINHGAVGKAIDKGTEAVVGLLKPKASEVYIRAHNCGVMNLYSESMTHAAELLKNDIITGSVSIALMSILIPIPKVGAFLGGLAGAAFGSYCCSSVVKEGLDAIIDDDTKEMLLIVEDVFQSMVNDYLLVEAGAETVLDGLRLHMLGQKLRQDQSPEYKKYDPEGLYD